MTSHKDPGRPRERETTSAAADDRAWASIFGIVIIAGLALAALFFYMNSGDNTPARHSSVQEHAPAPSAPAPTQRK